MLDKDPKRFLYANRRYLYLIAIGIVVIVVFWFSLRAALAVNSPFYVVPSESMVPILNVGDVVMIRNGEGYSFDDLEVGDIIVFYTSNYGGHIIVHRIVEIYSDSTTGDRLVKTKGDNNPESLPDADYPIVREDYYGKVVAVIPKVGILSTMIKPQPEWS
jgi:signal peptidase